MTKLDIYPQKPAEEKQVEPQWLEAEIRNIRHSVSDLFQDYQRQADQVLNTVFEAETQLVSIMKKYHDPREQLLPGILYVTLGGFAGSIIGKNRHILARLSLPLAGALGVGVVFYPMTALNLVSQRTHDPSQSLSSLWKKTLKQLGLQD